ncbi:MAG: metal-dependent hydrolase [Geobacteraceae bacterium GWC2_55_20]|nr:MAG: metal-dependent hydrolase [Geobacteraceae bacterium GWC2_55_20]OGU21128.1 MAG: metal-dependent hydrolase [Geobacteraceae bacterium GWF2_54_21]HBA70843.1 metal-dependent hydrolase [Geobacter sp.]HCE69518.1 metal-dependent hydrolase [Geobacter sp.]
MSEYLIHAASWLINPDEPPVAGGAILVRDGRVAAAGTLADLKRKYSEPVIEHPGCAILPGFINAHTHLELTHFPSWRMRTNIDYNPRRFTDWIIQLIKIARGLTPDDYPPSLREGIRMCLESGTTAVGEIVTNPALAGIYGDSRLTGRLYFEVLGQEQGRFNDKLSGALAAAASAADGSMAAGLSPHSPYTIGEEHLSTISIAALAQGLPLTIHLSESAAETDFIFDSSGPLARDFYPFVGWERYLTHPLHCTSTELLDRHGLLTPDTLAVHCVHVNLADARILKERGVSIALCPRSNDKLDVGRAPVALFRKLGIPLSLGTDSLASNDSLSLWDEMRYALETFPGELSERDVLRMVTSGAASALKISDSHGSLHAGMRADFQVVEISDIGEKDLLERIVRDGGVRDVYAGGVHFIG